jgi:diaminopimelate decarboxylase
LIFDLVFTMFSYSSNDLYADSIPLADIAATVGTPAYIYSARAIACNYKAYADALEGPPHVVCYAMKANSTRAILALLADLGSGFDIVSGGELYRVIEAGGDPGRVVFSGVGKTAAEVDYALECGIHSFNCESEAELMLIDALAARRGRKAAIALRVNPDVDAATHPYISTGMREHKFGIDIAEAEAVYDRARALAHLDLRGVSCHIGSQLLDTDPIVDAVDKVLALIGRLRAGGHDIREIDLGGGLGVAYQSSERAPEIRGFVQELRARLEPTGLTVMVEPGRSIVGPAGVLLTRVLYRKKTATKEFIVVDAAMNDLIRPSLYQSHHEIVPLRKTGWPPIVADVVGPVCETGDFLARDRKMANVAPGDYLAVCTAGAYGFAQASNYNSRLRPAEVLVEDDRFRVIRERETYADLVRGETR